MKKIIFTYLSLLLALGTTSAQSYTGLLLNVDGMTIGDMASFSQTQFQFGTARSMAMGGALSSLGSDPSVMSTNPAGLAMYQKSELSVTPLVTVQKSQSNAYNYGDNLTRFSLGNLSFVISIPLSDSGRGLLSINFGAGYNRLVDLNYDTSLYSTSSGSGSSIGQLFSSQLNNSGVTLSQISGMGTDFYYDDNITPSIWGAVAGYKIGLCDWDDNSSIWSPSWIGEGASVGHYLDLSSRGNVGEYNVSASANISNKIYIGMTLGVTRLKQTIDYNYSEDYTYSDSSDIPTDYSVNYAHYNQTAIVEGTGVNFKLGVIYRPIKSVRLSFAVHTPTVYSINRQYQNAAASSVSVYTSTSESGLNPDSEDNVYLDFLSRPLEDYDEEGWYFKTPTRILLGGSFMLGNRALLSVDYQYDFYKSMKMTSTPYGVSTDSYNVQIDRYYKGASTLRAGAEFRVTPTFSLRAGCGFSSSITTDSFTAENIGSPTIDNTRYYSAGLGYAITKAFSVDIAYMHHTTHYTDFVLFEADNAYLYSLDYVRHNIAFTTSFKF